MIRFALLLAAALAAAASGATLPVVDRQFMMKDFRGTFTGRFNVTGCPYKVFHEQSDKNATLIRHTDITVENVTCDDNGQLDLFPINDTDRVNRTLEPYRTNSASLNLLNTLIANARRVPGSFVGVSTADRKCGAFTLRNRSVVVFVKSENFDAGRGFPIGPGPRIMVYVEVGKTVFCPFSAKAANSPSLGGSVSAPTPTPAPPTSSRKSPSPSPSPRAATATTSTRPPCFPDVASVQLADGSFKTMAQVQIGDRVLVEGGKFSDVFMFTHKLSDVKHSFVQLSTASGHSLALTDGHYLRVNGAMQPAGNVVVGDELTLANGAASAVTRVAVVEGTGLYNPQTVEGSIVVDGVVASTYTTAVEMRAAHSMLSPLRMVYNMFGVSMRALESGADCIAPMLPKGTAVY